MNRYDWYKSRGICPQCGRADAAKGRVCCLDCLDKGAVRNMMYVSRNRERVAEENKTQCRERYKRLRDAGICVDCGERKTNGLVRCEYCAAKARYRYDKRRGLR